jgi:polysaccharide biosynthesis/export protein
LEVAVTLAGRSTHEEPTLYPLTASAHPRSPDKLQAMTHVPDNDTRKATRIWPSARQLSAIAIGRRTAIMLRHIIQATTLIAALSYGSLALADGDIRDYRLEPGDRINVTIFGHTELSGDLLVDGVGNILLPLVGPLEVKGLTTSECEKLVYDRLTEGILKQPTVSVRITELRPLYVLGDVRTPGAYQFRYGSSVKSAVALAGGLSQLVQSTALADFVLADERMRQLNVQKRALVIRRARIESQRNGDTSFSPPPQLGADDDPDIRDIIAVEQQTFNSQAALLKQQLTLLQSQRPRLEKEIAALSSQITTAKDQIDLVKKRLDQYGQLSKQGLGLSSTELQFKLTQAAYESDLWRLTAQTSRLQMDIGELDLKINEASAAFKRQLDLELRDVSDKLRELEITLPSAREIRELRLRQAASLPDADSGRTITITRIRGGTTNVITASDSTPLEPGDIIEVKQLLPRQLLQPGMQASDARTGSVHPESPAPSFSR